MGNVHTKFTFAPFTLPKYEHVNIKCLCVSLCNEANICIFKTKLNKPKFAKHKKITHSKITIFLIVNKVFVLYTYLSFL